MPQASKKRHADGSETASLEIDGRLEIRQMLVDYYVETRGRQRRTRMLVQESNFSLSAHSEQLALLLPSRLLRDANDSGEDGGGHRGDARVRIDIPGYGFTEHAEDVLKEHPDSLTFSTISASTTAMNDSALHVACNHFDILPAADFFMPANCPPIQHAYFGSADTDMSQSQTNLTFEVSNIGISLSQRTPWDLTESQQNPLNLHQLHPTQLGQVELLTSLDVMGCDARFNHQEHTLAGTVGEHSLQEMGVVEAFSLVQEDAGGDWDVMTVGPAVEAASSRHVMHHSLVVPEATIRPEHCRISSFDAMVNLSRSEGNVLQTDFVLPRFPSIEEFIHLERLFQEGANPKASLLQLNRGRGVNRSQIRKFIQDDFLPIDVLPMPSDLASGEAMVTTIGLSFLPRILKSLSRITARPGYLGSGDRILQSTTQEMLTSASWPLSSFSPVQIVGVEALETRHDGAPTHSTFVVTPPVNLDIATTNQLPIVNPTRIFDRLKDSRNLPAAA